VTEGEWLTCTDLWRMKEFLFTRDEQPSDRKYLLLACTCCRRLWHLLPDERFRQPVELMEQYVDGGEREEEERQALDRRLGPVLSQRFGTDSRALMTAEGLAAEAAFDLVAETPAVAADLLLNKE
jgi:hypothetical protein